MVACGSLLCAESALCPGSSEARYGALLGRQLDDPGALIVVSSDFCHWGSRFSYTFYDSAKGPIHKFIEWLDRQGMEHIEKVLVSTN